MEERIRKHEEQYALPKKRSKSAQTDYIREEQTFPDINPVPHPLRHSTYHEYLRVHSQPRQQSLKQKTNELKPLTESDVKRMRDLDFTIKLCDMGNACYIDKHFSDIIQTREYRSPEVILNADYDTSADMWSLACMVFELVTGDYLFDPKKGKTFKKNDDHLALITELIGECKSKQWL